MDKRRKVYVEVEVLFDIDGRMVPKSIHWEDGRVLYLCRIMGKEKYLFYDEPKWFVEAENI